MRVNLSTKTEGGHTMSEKSTSIGIAEHVAIALSYALGWISGLIILLIEKENDTVR
jgi:hypothetical protein